MGRTASLQLLLEAIIARIKPEWIADACALVTHHDARQGPFVNDSQCVQPAKPILRRHSVGVCC